jgi:hypothetical protein
MECVFHELGLVAQSGTVFSAWRGPVLRRRLPIPEFAELELRSHVTLRSHAILRADTDTVDGRLLTSLHTASGRSTAEIAKHLGLSNRVVQTRLARMLELGLAVVVGLGRRDPR